MNRKRKGRGLIYSPAQRRKCATNPVQQTLESPSSTVASAEVSREWQRCGEGFVLPVKEQRQQATLTSLAKTFGQTWIKPEALLTSSSHGSSHVPKVQVHYDSEIQRELAEDAEIICNSSDSDSNEQPQKQNSRLVQLKRSFKKSTHSKANRKFSARRKHSITNRQKEICDSVDSDSCDIVSDSGSDVTDENDGEQDFKHSVPDSGESGSPSSEIECIGSPEAHQDAEDLDENQSSIQPKDKAEAVLLPHKQQAIEGGTPSISSCSSSQTAADSEVSPGTSGLRASEWAKHVNWDTTPTKQKITSPAKDEGDSAKKKRKFKKGGLADQLSRIVLRDRSASRMWMHQQQTSEGPSQGASSKCMTVRVVRGECPYSLSMARCTFVDGSGHIGGTSSQCLALFSKHSSAASAKMKAGTMVKIFPPWQQLDAPDGQEKVLLCPRYQIVSTPESHHDPDMEDTSVREQDAVTSPSAVKQARWICPCSTDPGMLASNCPAHLFPVVPACLVQHSSSEVSGKVPSAGKTLLTVTSSEYTPKRVLTFDTLLESIEKSHTGDKLLPNFHATVLRVYSEREEDTGELKHLLLVEDSQGTVALIQGGDDSLTRADQDLEGRSCCFSRLRVQSRANRDKDPALFSAIEAAWRRNVRTTQSQESGNMQHSDDSLAHSQRNVLPPAFCYILAASDTVSEALSGLETVTVDSSQPVALPPLTLQTIASVRETRQQSSRVTLVGKVIYTTEKSEESASSDLDDGDRLELYIVDHTCDGDALRQSVGQQWSGYVRLSVRPGCCTDHIKSSRVGLDTPPYLVLLRDVWIVSDTWIADKFSNLWTCDMDEEKMRPLLEQIDNRLLESVRTCSLSLLPVTRTTSVNTLACISGVIQSVDEKSAFSWDECDSCGSDKLGTRCSTGTLVCMDCKREVTSPVQRMKMDVIVTCETDSSLTVKLSLQQSTIQRILPDEADEEGYDVDCVLSKHLGPLHCSITAASNTATGVQLAAKELL